MTNFQNKIITLALSIILILVGCSQNSSLVGKWELESSTNWRSAASFEFFRNGTGEMGGMSITWRVINGNRINITMNGQSQTTDYSLSGSTLTLIYDSRSNDRAVYRKVN